MVPEPANFYIFRTISQADETEKREAPIPPDKYEISQTLGTLQTFEQINLVNYSILASVYGVTDIIHPPARHKVVNKAITLLTSESEGSVAEESLIIPDGYVPRKAYVKIRFTDLKTDSDFPGYEDITMASVIVQVGHMEATHSYSWRANAPILAYSLGSVASGKYELDFSTSYPSALYGDYIDASFEYGNYIPITCKVFNTHVSGSTAIINVEVVLEQTPKAYNEWRIQMYASIMQGYERQKAEYEEWLEAQIRASENLGEIEISGNNPLINRQIEKEELKKRCIELFSGQRFESFDAAVNGIYNESNYPEIRFAESGKEGLWVKYFEQVFDWQNMLYIFYPYYYGRKRNWLTIKALKSLNDPLFEKFLQAGYARVVVPVRLGFEKYTLGGNIGRAMWIADNNPDYMPLGDNEATITILGEIISSQDVNPEELEGTTPVGAYHHTVPTNLIYIIPETDPPSNPLPDNSADPTLLPPDYQ